MRYPECAPKYKDFDFGRKFAKEQRIVSELPNVPDAQRHMMLDGVGLDTGRIDTETINLKNHELGGTMNGVNDRTRSQLDHMDNNLFKSADKFKIYKDGMDKYSRFGGLTTGEHKINYNTTSI